MGSTEQMLEAIDALYGAALDSDLWPDALHRLSRLTGGAGAIVVSAGTASSTSIASPSLDEGAADYALNGWWEMDALREGARRRGLGGGVFTHHDLVGAETVRRHPFFREFLERYKLQAVATYFFKPQLGPLLSLAVPRPSKNGEFESSDLAALQALGPHAARALAMSSQLARSAAPCASLDALLDGIDVAIIVVDRGAKVRTMNRAARDLIGHAFTIDRGTLRAQTATGQRGLDQTLSIAFAAPLAPPRQHLIPRHDGGQPFLVHAFRIPGGPTTSILDLLSEDLALLSFTDTSCRSWPEPIASLRALGLTATETRVATSLGTGATTSEAAEHLGIAIGTLRAHLKSIFGKLDIRRQSDLTRLVARLALFR